MAAPVVLLAFANQADNHLPLLKHESSGVKDALRHLEKREFIRLQREESATTDSLMKTLRDYPDQLMIFHYGGHAESTGIDLEDQRAESLGLARLLGQQSSLKLVFLNGCSTFSQVQQLFDAGVPAVIATSVPVGDEKAVDLAKAFYGGLAARRNISEAFEFARAMVETRHKRVAPLEVNTLVTRAGRAQVNPPQDQPAAAPWGLYIHPDREEEIKSFRLPSYRDVGLSKSIIRHIDNNFELNKYLVLILDEMCRYNTDIYHQMVEVRDGEEIPKDSSSYVDLVIKNFPWAIGAQLRLLRQYRQPDIKRLEQLMSTYIISGQLVYYILLSNIWEEMLRLEIPAPDLQEKFLPDSPEEILTFPWLERGTQLAQFFQKHKEARWFVPEMKNFYLQLGDNNHPVAKSNAYLASQLGTWKTIDDKAVMQSCLITEQALAGLLRGMGWLAAYQLLTVRGIRIDNPRFGEIAYDINFGTLNAIVDTSLSLYETDARRRKGSYSNCNSILLAPTEDDLRQSLNLAPFVVDRNTFLDNPQIDLYLFGFKANDRYHYLSVRHSIYIAVGNERGTEQFHTGMTEEDFIEGRNITHTAKNTADQFGFGGPLGVNAPADESTVFVELEVQFQQMSNYFGRKHSDK